MQAALSAEQTSEIEQQSAPRSPSRHWVCWSGLSTLLGQLAAILRHDRGVGVALILLVWSAALTDAADVDRPWSNRELDPDSRAVLLVRAMTNEEKLVLIRGFFGVSFAEPRSRSGGAVGSAGYVPGIARLGIPSLQETDGSLGITNPYDVRPGDTATAMPSGMALAASWNPDLAHEVGSVLGKEARQKGFNVLLGGGVNLAREPRNGRNFEYLGEDPLLAGIMAGEEIRGTQEQGIIATVKHFAFNDQGTRQTTLNVSIDRAAGRESDLLAFEIAIERGHPGAVMCAHNKIGGRYACANDWLLNHVLKGDWRFPGWVMSDWGAVHDLGAAMAGLDQASGSEFDEQPYFDRPLKEAIEGGAVPAARLDDMVQRILRSMFAAGLLDSPAPPKPVDHQADDAVALKATAGGMVLLKNNGHLLPLDRGVRRIAIIGGYGDQGVPAGAGSSEVAPSNDAATIVPLGGSAEYVLVRRGVIHPSSPVAALRRRMPQTEIRFANGAYRAEAQNLAKWADIAIVLAVQWTGEGWDVPDLSLPSGQDQLIESVAAVNPRTVVVLETGGAVEMPWLAMVPAVLEAWYPGQRGGDAIVAALLGEREPGGRLPITFPESLGQLPHQEVLGFDRTGDEPANVDYGAEGSNVGYRWFAAQSLEPLFTFGYGLSYTQFAYTDLKVAGEDNLTISFSVRNIGSRAGEDVAQVYLISAPGPTKTLRLLGWQKVSLAAGEAVSVIVTADLRLLGAFDPGAHR